MHAVVVVVKLWHNTLTKKKNIEKLIDKGKGPIIANSFSTCTIVHLLKLM